MEFFFFVIFVLFVAPELSILAYDGGAIPRPGFLPDAEGQNGFPFCDLCVLCGYESSVCALDELHSDES
jgi:hypothetical protein